MPADNKKNIIQIDKMFGRIVKFSRVSMGLSLKEAADRLADKYQIKVSSSYLSLIENGDRYMINEQLFMAIKEFFQVADKRLLFKENEGLALGETINAKQVPVIYSSHSEKHLGSELLLIPGLNRIDLAIHVEDNRWANYGLLPDDVLLCVKVADKPNIDDLVVFTQENCLQLGYMGQKNGTLGIINLDLNIFLPLENLTTENILGVGKGLVQKHLSYRDYQKQQMSTLQKLDEQQLYAEIARRKKIAPAKLQTAIQVIENILLDGDNDADH